jgi:hypothetical protein
MIHRPPRNDRERLENLVEGLSEPAEVDVHELETLLRAELARRGLTLQTWNAAIHRARRRRKAKIAVALTAGVCAVAAAGVLAVHALHGLPDGVDVQQRIRPLAPATQPDAGRGAPRGR